MTSTVPVYDPFSHEVQEDPYAIYGALLEDAPVYRSEARGFWALSRFDDIQRACRAWKLYSSSAGVRVDDLLEIAGPSILTMDPPLRDVLRAVVREHFQLRAVAALEDEVTRIARALIDELDGDDEIDLAGGFAKRLPVLVICGLMGLPAQDAAMLKGWGDDVLETRPARPARPSARTGPSSWRTAAARRAATSSGRWHRPIWSPTWRPLRLLLSRWPDFDVAEAERFHDVTLRTFKHLVIRVA
jgi:cytochrome P450